MLDGKAIQAITGTSSSAVCYICGCKPSEMNNLDAIKSKTEKESALHFGLSTLHAWIRFMECILHIAYRLEFKKWATPKTHKETLQVNKERIQTALRKKLNILVDIPKQGSGTTNDGKTARKFFQNYIITSQITEE